MDMANLTNREAVALHEAGHAVVAHTLDLPLRSITLRSNGVASGGSVEMDHGGTWPELEEAIPRGLAALAAGRLAEHLAGVPTEASEDEEKLVRLVTIEFERRLPRNLRDSRAVAQARADALRTMLRGSALAELALRAEWGAVRRLASWLLQGPYLRADQAIACIEGAALAPLLCTEERLDQLGKYAGSDAAGFTQSPAFVALVTKVTRAKHEAEFEALVAEHEAERIAAREYARLAPSWEKRATFERPAPIHPRRPAPQRVPWTRPYYPGAA